jgi:Icc-related predicted phosphoesterase
MKLVIFSDTHNQHAKVRLPQGDVLVFAGDMSEMGSLYECEAFINYFNSQPHKHKVMVAGNHDFAFEESHRLMLKDMVNGYYLDNEMITVNGLTLFGSPYSPKYGGWAFMQERGSEELIRTWSKIPDKCDIVMTHTPMYGYHDLTNEGVFAGCVDLRNRMEKVDFKMHICGHIHEGYGSTQFNDNKLLINAAICNRHNKAVNPPIEVEYDGTNFKRTFKWTL